MGPFGGHAKVGGGLDLGLLKLAGSEKQRVDQVIGGVDIPHRRAQALRMEGVRHDDLRAGPPCLICGRGVPHHRPDPVSAGQQLRQKSPADVPGGAGHQDRSDLGPRAAEQLVAKELFQRGFPNRIIAVQNLGHRVFPAFRRRCGLAASCAR